MIIPGIILGVGLVTKSRPAIWVGGIWLALDVLGLVVVMAGRKAAAQ